jgi:hypothetical protein
MNRTRYDQCATVDYLKRSTTPFDYVTDIQRYEHTSKCRPDVGILAGTNVSHLQQAIVDVENNLQGRDRPVTRCPEYLFAPGEASGHEYIKLVQHPEILEGAKKHLPSCPLFATGPGQTQYPPPPGGRWCS